MSRQVSWHFVSQTTTFRAHVGRGETENGTALRGCSIASSSASWSWQRPRKLSGSAGSSLRGNGSRDDVRKPSSNDSVGRRRRRSGYSTKISQRGGAVATFANTSRLLGPTPCHA